MIKNKKLLICLAAVFLFVEAALAILLQTSQALFPINLRDTVVIFACLFCIVLADRSLSYLFTQAALILTVCADYFLVYSPELQQLPAMIFFSFVQISYFLRIYFEDTNATRKRLHLIIRLALSVAGIIVTLAVLGDSADAVAVVSVFYYVNLLLNAAFAFMHVKKNLLLAFGLLLFILCDTVIGLTFLRSYLTISPESVIYKIIYPGFDLAWAFYAPSQTLLAISLLPQRLFAAPQANSQH